jgi:hypothetical protein
MSVHHWAWRAAVARQRSPLWRGSAALRRCFATLCALMLTALAGACTAPPPSPSAGPDPSDASARTRPVGYRSTIAPYESQRPVEPKPWEQQNERVGPSQRQ